MMQTTDHLLMVRPVNFGFNEQTAVNNAFQQKIQGNVAECAVEEFDAYVRLLTDNGVLVEVVHDTPEPHTPDSIFPNNCFSTHRDENGKSVLVLYPMFAHNRRMEREKLVPWLKPDDYDTVFDLRKHENHGEVLEGTGSLVLDRLQKVAYACLSPRTSESLLNEWAARMNYKVIAFDSHDEKGTRIYHTNVMLHVGTNLAVACLDTIADEIQRKRLVETLKKSGKEIVPIRMDQMHHFAGNMLEIHNDKGEKILVMSKTARQSLTPQQVSVLENDLRILSPDIHTIETVGGGSARCMIAEIF